MKATPPLRLYATAVASFSILLARFGVRAIEPHPLRTWLILGCLFAASGLVIVAIIAATADDFTIQDGKLSVGTWWKPSRYEQQDLAALSSVEFTTSRLMGKPLAVVAFKNGASYEVPVRYQGGAEVARFLFSQLGQNVSARSAA
jgi:hypothetical protein